MEVKIKEGNSLNDATIEMVDGVMVVSPKEVDEVKFEPKDGDVIVSGGDVRFVAIFKRTKEEYSFYYHAVLVLGGDKKPQLDSWASFLNARPATEEEKKKLFDKLAEEGYSWDADKKELVKLKWKPKYYETYYAPVCSCVLFNPCEFQWKETDTGASFYNKGWCFKTEQECQEFCNKLNEAINQVKP